MLRFLMLTALLCTLVNGGFAQAPSTSTAACDFQDGRELSVRHNSDEANPGKTKLPEGQLWTPGGAPMFLFTDVPLSIGNSNVPAGAYSVYVIPEKGSWTLVLNKKVTGADKYDQAQDLARVPMQIGQLSAPEKFAIAFGHVAPKQCNMRIYYGKTGAWAEFKED